MSSANPSPRHSRSERPSSHSGSTQVPSITTSRPSPKDEQRDSISRSGNGSYTSVPDAPLKTPMYNETALQVSSSPPLTSYLNDRHSASSKQEETYLSHSTRLHWTRLLLSILILATSTTALACSAHTLHTYNQTNLSTKFNLNLWPTNLNLKPTLSVLICSAIILPTCLIYIIIALIPSPHSRARIHTLTFLALSLLTLTLSLFSLAFVLTQLHHSSRPSIESFTCRFYRGPGRFNKMITKLQMPVLGTVGYPSGFERMCVESEVGWGMMAGQLGLGCLGLVLGTVGWVVERGIERGRNMRWEEKFPGEKN